MASLTKRKNGSRFITFLGHSGKLRTVTLGKVPGRYADTVKVRVEDLASARASGHPPQNATLVWLNEIDDRLFAKLANVGLVAARVKTPVVAWLDQYLAERVDDLKPESHRKLKQTRNKLAVHFDAQRELRSLTPEDAVAWRSALKQQGLSEAAIKTHCGNAKTMLAEAVRRKTLAENPFIHLKSGATPSAYSHYVTPEITERVIEACPDSEWRLLVGLARYAGLRIPSESQGLTWEDVDFDHARLTVRSPKTEHHIGHEQRVVPITPRLMELIQERFDDAGEGERHLVTLAGKGAVIRPMRKIWKRAGVEPWKRLWQTLRQSCEKQWAMDHPQYAVSKWIGHSITVSGRHYANDVPQEVFDRVTERPHHDEPKAQRHAQRKMSESSRKPPKRKRAAEQVGDPISGLCKSLPDISANSCQQRKWSRGDSNPRVGTVNR